MAINLADGMRKDYSKINFSEHTSLRRVQKTAEEKIDEKYQGHSNIDTIKKDTLEKIAQEYSGKNVARIAKARKAGIVHRTALRVMVKTETILRKMGMDTLANHPCAVLLAGTVLLNSLLGLLYSHEKNT